MIGPVVALLAVTTVVHPVTRADSEISTADKKKGSR